MKRKIPNIEHDFVDETVEYMLKGSNDINVVFGPIQWQPSDGAVSKRWYFVVATSEEGRGFRCDSIQGQNQAHTEQLRQQLLLGFGQRRPLVLHDCDDELYMARLCETLWPGARITKLRKEVERERAELMP